MIVFTMMFFYVINFFLKNIYSVMYYEGILPTSLVLFFAKNMTICGYMAIYSPHIPIRIFLVNEQNNKQSSTFYQFIIKKHFETELPNRVIHRLYNISLLSMGEDNILNLTI